MPCVSGRIMDTEPEMNTERTEQIRSRMRTLSRLMDSPKCINLFEVKLLEVSVCVCVRVFSGPFQYAISRYVDRSLMQSCEVQTVTTTGLCSCVLSSKCVEFCHQSI